MNYEKVHGISCHFLSNKIKDSLRLLFNFLFFTLLSQRKLKSLKTKISTKTLTSLKQIQR